MPYIKTKDGANLFYKDWGTGKTIILVHGWSVGSDSFEYQMLDLVSRGMRVVAYDQRGCGRSDQTWDGYDFDTLASDLAALIETLDIREATLVGHSMGCGVITRYLSKYGGECISKSVLGATTTPYLLKTEDNPQGIDKSILDGMVEAMSRDRQQYTTNLAPAFFGVGLPGIEVSPELIQWGVNLCFQASIRAAIEMQKTNFTTDQRKELREINVSTLIIHGDKDVNNPFEITGAKTAELMPNANVEIYEGMAHGFYITHPRRFNDDIIAFIES